MNSFFSFLIESSGIFTLFYLVYRLVLSKLTFYQLNRWVLLFFIPLSLIITYVDVFSPIQVNTIDIPILIEFDNASNQNEASLLTENSFNFYKILATIYFFGIVFFLFSFIKSLYKLFILKEKSSFDKVGKYRFYHTKHSQVFSCFNWIFIPENMEYDIHDLIIEHEKKHVDFKHTYDLIFIELYILFFWFNPFVFLYRKSLKSVHEFQADDTVLRYQKHNLSEYLKLLKSNIEKTSNSKIYSYFKNPIAKKRIEMIFKPKTNNIVKIKYLILAPVCLLCMLSYTKPNITKVIHENIKNTESDIPSILPILNTSEKDITSHFGASRKFGENIIAKIHNGIDLKAKINTPIIATADGTIAYASYKGNWGNLIVVTHNNGYETWYAHLESFNAKKSEFVKKGEIIGYSGDTGFTKGPHLHYAIKHNGKFINPIKLLK